MTDAYSQGATQISLRNDTSANWHTTNPVLAVGEFGVNTTNNRVKIGDGITAWDDLPYQGAGKGNLLLNGDFSVQQHPSGKAILTDPATSNTVSYYGIDRWRTSVTGKRSTFDSTVGSAACQWTATQVLADVTDALSEGYKLTNYLSMNASPAKGDAFTKVTISQRIDTAEATVRGTYTLSWWARISPLLEATGDNPTYGAWISPYYKYQSDSSATSSANVRLGTTWKRFSKTFDLSTPAGANKTNYLEVGLNLPTEPMTTWTKNLFTSKTALTVGANATTIRIEESTGRTPLVPNAKIRLTGRADSSKVMEGTINSVIGQDVQIVVTDKFTGSGYVQAAGTAPAWDIAVSMYSSASITPAAGGALNVAANTVSPEVTVGKMVSIRSRSNPQNWVSGKVESISGSTLTVNNQAGTALKVTQVNVTSTTSANIYAANANSVFPVGTRITILPNSYIPDAVEGTWTVTGGGTGYVTITGSGFTVANTTIASGNQAFVLFGTDFGWGGTADSSWDINVQTLYHNEIDIWGVQFEPDRGASMFQVASGNRDAEVAACQRYYQALDKQYLLVTSYDTSPSYGYTQIAYSPKRTIPAITFPSAATTAIADANYDVNWVDGDTESVTSAGLEATGISNSNARVKVNVTGTIGAVGSTGYLNINAPVYVDAEL